MHYFTFDVATVPVYRTRACFREKEQPSVKSQLQFLLFFTKGNSPSWIKLIYIFHGHIKAVPTITINNQL